MLMMGMVFAVFSFIPWLLISSIALLVIRLVSRQLFQVLIGFRLYWLVGITFAAGFSLGLLSTLSAGRIPGSI
jgi:hypothetical protein